MIDPQKTVLLIDVSAIAHAIWHVSETITNRDQIAADIVSRVRNLSHGFPCVAVCCDSGKSFRNSIDPQYKANRPERNAGLYFQLNKALDRLRRDGFVVWSVPGFEADDIIASATELAVERDYEVLIASHDKDLLQLVCPVVRAKSLRDGSIIDEATVEAKYGVTPAQMRDYLTLLGDKSDNVPGAHRIGAVTAAKLLKAFRTLDTLYDVMDNAAENESQLAALTLSNVKALEAFRDQLPITRSLITMRTDVPIDIDLLIAGKERTISQEETSGMPPDEEPEEEDMPVETPVTETVSPAPTTKVPAEEAATVGAAQNATTAIVKADEIQVVDGEIVFERQLEPRNMREAERMATILNNSGMFLKSYPNAPAVMTAILTGRELGLPTMASLRAIHVIDGKASLSASVMVALIFQRGIVEFFEVESGDDKQCTIVAKRKDGRKEQRIQHTIEMAERAGLVRPGSNWIKAPEDMLYARASSRLARRIAPELLFGLYTPEELIESKENQ